MVTTDTTTTDTGRVRRVVIYCRTSEADPVEQQRLDQQAGELEIEAIVNGWTVVDAVEDLSQPGNTIFTRPALLAALGAVEAGRADALLVCDTGSLSDDAKLLKVVFELAALQGWQILTPKPPPQNLGEDLEPSPEDLGALPEDLRRALDALTPRNASNMLAAEPPHPISPIRRWRRG
jgi:hypothetical protein